ncbi:MMPL family transporter [Pontibacter sp. G13]|uniref:efflux RND transporter permease subunit n=1 Tax=Pontibacter sp. G13 TaxID=3074898 RepID=UPI00288AA266|nr:MMPL family transporter [Pontibacter sp. G13]WNJ20765.1 MMPL family transporter [Pontibacter sp. G13]
MNHLLKYRRIWLGILMLGTLILGYGVTKVRINFSFDQFYPKDDPEYTYYSQYIQQFQEEQNFINYIALKAPGEDVFDREFLKRADSVFEAIRALPGTDSLVSATSVEQYRLKTLKMVSSPWMEFETEADLRKSRKRIEQDSLLIGGLITRDFQHVCAFVFIEPEIFDTRKRDEFNQSVVEVLESSGIPYVISGIPYIRTQYIGKIGRELLMFMSISICLIISVLFWIYRTGWGVWIPVAAVLLGLMWIMGIMGYTGQSVDLISNLLIPLMFVVGTSDVIHLTTRFLQENERSDSPHEAMRITLKEIGLSIFLTSLTTAVGFASLLVSRVPPIRNFGLYAAIGVVLTYILTIILLPNAFLWLSRKKKLTQKRGFGNQPQWNTWMDQVFRWVMQEGRLIGWTFGGLVALSIALIFTIPTNTFLIEDIGEDDPIKQSMYFFEEQSVGLRPFELGIHMKGEHLATDRDFLVQLDSIQEWLDGRQQFGIFLSPATLVKEANYLAHFNRAHHRRIPDSQEEIDRMIGFMANYGGNDLMAKVTTQDFKQARISSRVPDLGTDEFEKLYRDLDEYVLAHCDTSMFSYRYTGQAFLTEHNLMYVRRSLLFGLGIAFAIVGLIMGMLFKSWRMLLISMVPNVIPLIFTGGIMGAFQINLTASTALVFVIAFGIAVDDTIHFLMRYRKEIQIGNPVDVAIRNTLHGTGKAMIITSLILVAGFMMLCFSDFGGTWSTGMFTSLTIGFALLSDLVLLPVLIRWVYPTEISRDNSLRSSS